MNTNDPLLKRFGLRSKSQRQKYDRFVHYYLLSFDACEAYSKVSGDISKTSCKRLSYKVIRHPYVVHELNRKNREFNKKMDKKILMNREKIINELESILSVAKNSDNLNAALKSLDQLAKVVGAYAPEKSEVEHKGVTINYMKPSDK